jgi:hypothetical protein
VDLLLKDMPREKIHALEDRSPDSTPLKLAWTNRSKVRKGIREGKYNAQEYEPILKEYDAIVDLLEKHAPPQRLPRN